MNTTMQDTGGGTQAGQQVASSAVEQAGQVSQQAAAQAKEVAGTAAAQARQVSQEAAGQARSMLAETKGKAHDQAEAQTQQLATAMSRLGDQARSLLAGKPEGAGSLGGYAENAVSKLDRLTQRVQEGGFDGVLADVQRLARRRPGVFLMGGVALGFGVGRLLRAGVAQQVSSQPSASPGQSSSDSAVTVPAPAEVGPAIVGEGITASRSPMPSEGSVAAAGSEP